MNKQEKEFNKGKKIGYVFALIFAVFAFYFAMSMTTGIFNLATRL